MSHVGNTHVRFYAHSEKRAAFLLVCLFVLSIFSCLVCLLTCICISAAQPAQLPSRALFHSLTDGFRLRIDRFMGHLWHT